MTLTEACAEVRIAETQLEEQLKRFDFTFEYSDDGRAYRKGHEQYKRILALAGVVGKTTYRRLWNQYCPDYMQLPEGATA